MKQFTQRLMQLSASALLLASSGQTGASLINEAEVSGTQINNMLATAQALPGGAFTQPEPATVFPRAGSFTATVNATGGAVASDPDVDFFSFSTIGSNTNTAILDIDGAQFDTVMGLFDSLGTLIAVGDDTDPADAGSANHFSICTSRTTSCSLDSLIGEIVLAPGTYYVAVSEWDNFPDAYNNVNFSGLSLGGFSTIAPPVGVSGFPGTGVDANLPYTLHVSLQPAAQSGAQSVPEPSMPILLGLGLMAIGTFKRRRK